MRCSYGPVRPTRPISPTPQTIRFVLDANVFISAHRTYYAFDIVPCFWRMLVELAEKGLVASIDRVKEELQKGEDPLKIWALSEFDQWFLPSTTDEVVDSFRQLMEWTFGNPDYEDVAKNQFADVADSWLVAFAKAYNYVVVTHEQPKNSPKKIYIPNACKAMGVQYMNTFEMFRKLNVKLCA